MESEEEPNILSSSDVKTNCITESHINNYFSKCSVLSKSVISEQRSLAKFLGERWNELDSDRKDSLLDLLFVEDEVRQLGINSRYSGGETQESFPRLYINSGQKINVDFENDLWTWRDEHSGPFSWMSRSQQDLTLTDFETENISKPQPKTLRLDLDNEDNLKKAEEQFSNPANCWNRDVIDDYRKMEKNITLTPCVSLEFSHSDSEDKNDEETIEANGESQTETQNQKDQQQNVKEADNKNGKDSSKRKNSGKERRKRSPSPKKMLRSSSLRRSPSKTSDGGEQQLISMNKDDKYEEQNAFSNPLVETQWSSFVSENANESSTDVHNVPMAQVMDRGVDFVSRSPYQVQKDNVQLITPGESPAQSVKVYSAVNDLGGWSAESTPDHTTHLLKGMQKDNVEKSKPSTYQFASKQPNSLKDLEGDEVLTVESVGTDFTISTKSESEAKRDSDIPTTGFDFLDNW